MSLISRRFHDFSDHEQFYDCGTIILYDICIAKFVNPSSAGEFACSAGELEIVCESWRLQPKAGDFAAMIFKDHIDRLSTDVRLNNNYDMVCGIIFSRDFTFQISSFNTI